MTETINCPHCAGRLCSDEASTWCLECGCQMDEAQLRAVHDRSHLSVVEAVEG